MTYDEWKAALQANEQAMDRAADIANAYPRGPMGLTLESSKDSAWHDAMRTIELGRTIRMRLHRHCKAYSKRSQEEARLALQAKRAAIVAAQVSA